MLRYPFLEVDVILVVGISKFTWGDNQPSIDLADGHENPVIFMDFTIFSMEFLNYQNILVAD